MKRLQRLSSVRALILDEEQRQAARLSQGEQRLTAAQARFNELELYRADYARQLGTRTSAGISALQLRDHQTFLARLDEALRQQAQMITRASTELEFERGRWRDAAIRLKSVSTVISKWEHQDLQQADRRAQLEIDERALQQSLRTAANVSGESGEGLT